MRNRANQQGRRIINGAEEVDGRFQVDVLDLLNRHPENEKVTLLQIDMATMD